MILKLSKIAQTEIEDAKGYYNLQQDNLGVAFKKDIQNTIDNIINFPKLYPNITSNIKRAILHRFPYSIFYTINEDTIIILTVSHQHRKPIY